MDKYIFRPVCSVCKQREYPRDKILDNIDRQLPSLFDALDRIKAEVNSLKETLKIYEKSVDPKDLSKIGERDLRH